MKHKILITLSLVTFCISGCKKLVDVEGPSTSVNSANIYNTDVTAASVLTGIYTNLSLTNPRQENLLGISYFTGLSSDELSLYINSAPAEANAYYSNALSRSFAGGAFWENIYSQLYVINSALEGVTNSKQLTQSVKTQLIGEAKFLRAFCFFYLVNLYGDVPLVLGTDYKTNSLIFRSPKQKVWEQIVKDLKDAQILLSSNYLDATLTKSTEERVRPTKWAASALLARVFLYMKDWQHADEQATILLENPIFTLVDLDDAFLKNNKEAIWQLQPVDKNINAREGDLFVLRPETALSSQNPAFLNEQLVNSFEQSDERKIKWISSINIDGETYWYSYKYKVVPLPNVEELPFDEYSTIFRLAEQYLIRAEARLNMGNKSGSIEDLDMIRMRAGLNLIKDADPNMTESELESSILVERRHEFFTEWGHRWFDLKRTETINAVMQVEVPQKSPGMVWKSFQQYYPISANELQNNPNLIQNEGY